MTDDRACTLHAAAPADVPALVALAAAGNALPVDAAAWAREFAVAGACVAMARDEDARLVGVVVYWRLVDETEIHHLAVAAPSRRRGVGRDLVRHVLDVARAAGHRRVLLEVRAANRAAHALYRMLGFRAIGRRQAYYRDPEDDAVLLAHPLSMGARLAGPAAPRPRGPW